MRRASLSTGSFRQGYVVLDSRLVPYRSASIKIGKKLGACRSEICSDFLGYGATTAIAGRSEQISDLHAPNVVLWAKPALEIGRDDVVQRVTHCFTFSGTCYKLFHMGHGPRRGGVLRQDRRRCVAGVDRMARHSFGPPARRRNVPERINGDSHEWHLIKPI